MSEESFQERTEAPTPKRRKEARDKGQVPRSRELNTLLSIVAAAAGLLVLGDSLAQGLLQVVRDGLSFDYRPQQVAAPVASVFGEAFLRAMWVLAPLFAVLVFAALGGSVVLGGWTFSPSALAPKFERLSPLKGIKRIFSGRGLVELIKALAKFVLVAAVAVAVLWMFLDDLLGLSASGLGQAIAQSAHLLAWTLLSLSLALLVIAAIDVPFQLFQHNKQLRMTRQEVRDELKESEGRPEVRSRIRNLQREMARRRMMERVPAADVVVTNPTHYAVALKYDTGGTGAPVVVAKGRDLVAARIRDIAREHNVVLFSAPPLARALYATTELDQEIPQQLFLAVAQVLAYVFKLKTATGSGAAPEPPMNLDVPDDLWRNEEPSSP